MPARKKCPSQKSTKTKKGAKKDPSKKARAEVKQKTAQTISKSSKGAFPVVGVGASAGGVEALEDFFENLPAESGMSFVVITHTDPKRTSLMPSIISRKTKLTVKLIEEGMAVEPNTVFMPPSDHDLLIDKEIFHLKKRPPRGEPHMPVDFFLKHLAKERGGQAGCVILSGTGTDGTYGLRAVKEHAGVAIVQSPESARHAGMPVSALDTGLADFVNSPAEMPGLLIQYFKHPAQISVHVDKRAEKETESIKRVLAFLTNRTRHDFSFYKDGTIERRIARRLAVNRCRDLSEYLKTLHRDEREIKALFQDLLIGVTTFFRDPDAFSYLKEHVLAGVFSTKKESENLRVWVPGCATGEEAFSVAMILKEYMDENHIPREMQIFGTDIDDRAIEKARAGEYLQNIAVDVGTERLERFFIKKGNRYHVKREIRESVVFAAQNLLRDPPFSNLDLLVCRNLLIYLKSEAQERLIPLFHYTLKKDGILFLGNSESIGRFPELFKPESRKHSIFRKKQTAVRPQVQFPTGKISAASHPEAAAAGRDEQINNHDSLEQTVKKDLLEGFTPPCAIVDESGEVFYTRGRAGKYLELGSGRPNLNIADMAREGLRFSLLSALRKCRDGKGPIREKGLRVKINNEHLYIDLTVKRFSHADMKNAMMVVFEEVPAPQLKAKAPPENREDVADKDRIEALESELVSARQEHRSIMEELESSNEELRSTNEELHSANEELQSTNEELESSREELQSLNEELNTVNSELQKKIEELHDSHQVITEALNSTQIAVVYLDNELRIARFTATASRIINLIESDLGRPLEHISDNLEVEDLCEKAGRVLKTMSPHEEEVKTNDGDWYRMNIMIYRRDNYIIEGIVLTFINIDSQKRVQQQIEEMKSRQIASARRFAENIIDTIREPLLVLDEKMRVISANHRFYRTFDTVPESTEGKSLFELEDGQWDIPELRKLLKEIIAKRHVFDDYQVEHRFPKVGLKKMLLNGRYLQEEDGAGNKILLAIEDVSDK
jgi:two-component system CheB/CheR fusion protein